MLKSPRDRFDDVPRATGRVGAHRAEQPGMNGLVVLLWSAAIALVLIVAGIFVTLVMMDRISLFAAPEGSGPASSSEVTAKVDTSYRVLIMNATPEADLAAEARDTLLSEGWATDHVLDTAGASEEFDKTTVFYVDKADEAAALGVAKLIGGADVQQSDVYAAWNDTKLSQLTLVIGMDKVTGAKMDAPTEAPAD